MAAGEGTVPDEDPRLRRSGFLGGAAFFLLATSLFLAWWVVTNRYEGSTTPLETVSPFGSDHQIAHAWAKWLTVLLVGGAALWLFVRVASAAWRHEPRTWNRDAGLLAILVLLALASGMLWPIEIPFWGGRTYQLQNVTGAGLTIVASPGLGWWVAAVAGGLLGAAWWLSRPHGTTEQPNKE
jgi:hypothetical protein